MYKGGREKAPNHFEKYLTAFAAKCRKNMEKMKTMDSIITTNGSLQTQEHQRVSAISSQGSFEVKRSTSKALGNQNKA
jgi:hypothetical protein